MITAVSVKCLFSCNCWDTQEVSMQAEASLFETPAVRSSVCFHVMPGTHNKCQYVQKVLSMTAASAVQFLFSCNCWGTQETSMQAAAEASLFDCCCLWSIVCGHAMPGTHKRCSSMETSAYQCNSHSACGAKVSMSAKLDVRYATINPFWSVLRTQNEHQIMPQS